MNQINIMSFGQIAEITGSAPFQMTAADTDEIQALLKQRFPALSNRKYAIAVDKVIVKMNTPLHQNAVIALLPPFSGG